MEVITNWDIQCGADIEKAIRRLDKEFYVANHKKFPVDHVFDENQTVKWNREEVIRRNQALQDEFFRARELKSLSHDHLLNAIIKYIMEDAVYSESFTESEARIIWQHTINHHESNPWDWVDEMADTFHEFKLVIQKGAK